MISKFKVDPIKATFQLKSVMNSFRIKKLLYKKIFCGRGFDFEGYRTIQPGEDASYIDWIASARANKLLAKNFIEETNFDVYFIFDCSNSMIFGSGESLKAEYSAELICALSYVIMNANDRVGIIMHNEQIIKYIEPRYSTQQRAIINSTLCNGELYGGGYDLNNVLDWILKRIKSPFTKIIIVSDFLHISPIIEEKLRNLSSRFETMAFMIRDIFDEDLSNLNNRIIVQSPYYPSQITIDPKKLNEDYKKQALIQKEMVSRLFNKCGIDCFSTYTDKPSYLKLLSFFDQRIRRGMVRL